MIVEIKKSSASKSWSSISSNDFSQKSLPNLSFRCVTKLQICDQTSASIYRPNFSFKLSPNLKLQNLYETSDSKSRPSFVFKSWRNFSFDESTSIEKWSSIPLFYNWMNILLNWIKPNSNFWIDFLIEFSRKKGYWIFFWI